VEWVTEPYAETGVILRQDLCHVIVSDEVSLMELREHPFSEGFFNRLEVYLQERGKYDPYSGPHTTSAHVATYHFCMRLMISVLSLKVEAFRLSLLAFESLSPR
jgi:hypothetical protein